MLRDATRLTCNHIGVADKVEQRRFSVVNVTHDRHNRWPVLQIAFVIFLDDNGFFHFCTHKLHLVPKFFGDDGDGF